jgi:hypothetical protein
MQKPTIHNSCRPRRHINSYTTAKGEKKQCKLVNQHP